MSLFDMTASTNVRKLMVLNSEFPKDLEVINSDTATFVADISEHGRPAEYTYQWYVNEEMVNDATTAVYSRDTTADKGVYSVHCVITNKAGSVKTRTATLTVNALPKLDSSKPANVAATLKESITVEVAIAEHGYPKSYTFQWYLNGSKISGATSPTYDYIPKTPDKATLYCEVTNSAGTVRTRTATINVKYFFKAGMTSGLKTVAWKGHAYQSATAPSVSYKSDGAYITGPSSPGHNGVAYFDAIDLTNVTTITLKLDVSGMDIISDYKKCHCVAVWKTIGSGVYGSSASVISLLTNSSNVTHTLKVSSLTGSYYVGVGMRKGNSGSPKVVIKEIILS